MPLTLNNNELWERIRKVEGQQFRLIQTRQIFKVDKVVNEGVTTENVQKGKTYWLSRQNIIRTYEHGQKHRKYTSKDYEAGRIRVPRLAQIIALLAFALPEEIVPFSQYEGERLFGQRLRGIRKKDC